MMTNTVFMLHVLFQDLITIYGVSNRYTTRIYRTLHLYLLSSPISYQLLIDLVHPLTPTVSYIRKVVWIQHFNTSLSIRIFLKNNTIMSKKNPTLYRI